jgi:hypothetical protein
MRTVLAVAVFFWAVALWGQATQSQPPAPSQPPPGAQAPQPAAQPPVAHTQVSADLGSCSVIFKITDLDGKPIYDARIRVLIRYGFMGMRRLELDAGTDSAGEVRFLKMPDKVKRSLTFDISYKDQTAGMSWDPGVDCNARYEIPLGKAPGEKK